ncbi:class I SAM-dependent methyltransferase [Azospirillum halopraeferens]|uniref:class I SAM-dependent methyltransferase n=1 Tax=Azospirillum halopraeferens TaxID=34010 RepID=UPI0003FC979C|nr:class I SAM-dependent methyltransferase [Azospirillum halopraeferens]
MLHGLARLLPTIESAGLDEAAVYERRTLYDRPRAPVPAGGLLRCPVCGRSASRFLPFGLGGRRNAQCPDCGSLERHRFLWLYLRERTDFFRRRLTVLHTAPEPCLEAPFRAQHGRGYVTLDRFNPHADVQADLTDLPFPDAAFDMVVSSHVLEHVPDDRAALREIARVLKPSGRAVLMFPFDPRRPTAEDAAMDTPAKRMAAYGHPYHYRIYGSDTPARLAACGLSAAVVATRDLLSGHRRRRHRVNTNHLFLARRTAAGGAP